MKISVYTSAFNVIKNSFQWQEALDNFSQIADEVVVGLNTSEDGSLEAIQNYCKDKQYTHVTILSCSFSYDDILFDGKIKNAALQACSGDVLIGLDLDEFIPIRHKKRWRRWGQQLLERKEDSFMIPMINLWGDARKVRADQYSKIKLKWYMHKRGLQRGVVNFARLPNGKIDVDKSDTCELICANGELASYSRLLKYVKSPQEHYEFLENEGLFVFHTGYINFQNTIDKNTQFWQPHWEERGGKPYSKIPLTLEEMTNLLTINHNLSLWRHLPPNKFGSLLATFL